MKILKYFLISINILYTIICSPYIYTTVSSQDNSTSKDLSNNCYCDINEEMCDPFCCCDDSCNNWIFINKNWKANGLCWEPKLSRYDKWISYCTDFSKNAKPDDLFSPLRLYGENFRKGFCIIRNNAKINQQSSLKNFTATTSKEFEKLYNSYKVEPSQTPNEIYNKTVPLLIDSNDYSKFNGYSPYDSILGVDSGILKSIKIPLSDPYGLCNDNSDVIRLLQNRNFVCSHKLKINSNECSSFNNKIFDRILNSFIAGYDQVNKNYIIQSQNINFYQVVDKLYYYKIDINDIYSQTTILNRGCECSSIISKINYNFYMLNTTIKELEVNYFLENIEGKCDGNFYIPISYEVNFIGYNKTYDYKRSGNPGYIKGKPLITGDLGKTLKSNTTNGFKLEDNYVKQHINPRIIYGVSFLNSNRGKCYYNDPLNLIDETSAEPYYVNKQIPFINFTRLPLESGIFENDIIDNKITYQDKISWGCSDNFNITGLKNYCLNQLWKKKLLMEIFNNITYVSIFGNPNNQFMNDWITVDQLTVDSYVSSWDEFNNKCTIPAVINLDILYATYGLVNNTQHSIYKVQFRLDYIYWYSRSLDTNTKEAYYTYVNINYFRIPQEKIWFFAPPPGFIVFPRNIMYPFKIGTTRYNSSFSCLLDKLIIFIIILIIF